LKAGAQKGLDMSKQQKLSLKSIVGASVPAPIEADAVRLAQPVPAAQKTLKERAKQLSVYLEPPVYDQLRDIAYSERTKIHPLMLEALDLLFKQRGALPIRELEKRASR
jgi:hypothetical protein